MPQVDGQACLYGLADGDCYQDCIHFCDVFILYAIFIFVDGYTPRRTLISQMSCLFLVLWSSSDNHNTIWIASKSGKTDGTIADISVNILIYRWVCAELCKETGKKGILISDTHEIMDWKIPCNTTLHTGTSFALIIIVGALSNTHTHTRFIQFGWWFGVYGELSNANIVWYRPFQLLTV